MCLIILILIIKCCRYFESSVYTKFISSNSYPINLIDKLNALKKELDSILNNNKVLIRFSFYYLIFICIKVEF